MRKFWNMLKEWGRAVIDVWYGEESRSVNRYQTNAPEFTELELEHIEACKRIIASGNCFEAQVFCPACSKELKDYGKERGFVECPKQASKIRFFCLNNGVASAKQYLKDRGIKV